MAHIVKDRVKENTTSMSGTGTLTLNGAPAGFQTFAAIGDGNTCDYVLIDGVTGDWETGIGTYTASGTQLARSVRESSQGGSLLNLSSGVHSVFCSPTAQSIMRGLAVGFIAGTNAAVTCVTNSTYIVDMSAWATSDRIYTMPASPAVGDRVAIIVSAGNASYELIIKGNTSQTINGGSAASEWSRLFITGEKVVLRYIASNAWVVEDDRRIPQHGLMRLSTDASGESGGSFVRPAASNGAWTADINVGSICTTASDKMTARRAGNYLLSCFGIPVTGVSDQKYFQVSLAKNGGTTNWLMLPTDTASIVSTGQSTFVGGTTLAPLAVDDYAEFKYRSEEGSRGLFSSASPALRSSFSMLEVL